MHKKIPFPLETSDFAKLYFGKDQVNKHDKEVGREPQ